MNIIVGSFVWAEDPAVAWIDGQVTKINGQEAVIQRSDGKEVCFGYLSLCFICLYFPSQYTFLSITIPHLTYHKTYILPSTLVTLASFL